MPDHRTNLPGGRVADVVARLLAERSITRSIEPEEDLRQAGLTSLDMVNLVLSIEGEFDFTIPESDIVPANFRSVAAISRLVAAILSRA